MLYRHTYRDIVWIDSELATEEEINELAHEFNLERSLAQELLAQNIKPVFQTFPEHFYFALHFPALKHTHAESQRQEIDFILGENILITNRYDTVDPIHKFSKSFEVEAITNPDESSINNSSVVLFGILRKLYRSVMYELEHQSHELVEIESDILGGKERELVARLSHESMNLLTVEQVLSGHREILFELKTEMERVFGDEMGSFLQAIQDEYERVMEKATLNRGLVNELRRTNDALLQTKQNEISKNLTVVATVALPMLVIADILSANFRDMPLIEHPHGFTITLFIMALASLLAFMVLKIKHWF